MRRSLQALAQLPSYSEKGRRARATLRRRRTKETARDEAEYLKTRLEEEFRELARLRNEDIAPVD